MRLTPRFLPLLIVPALSIFAAGCGHSEEEWQAQLDKYNRLAAEHQAGQKELEEAKKKVADLEKQLKEMGVNIEERDKKLAGLSSTLEERERALAEYKARAHQLELIKQRFEKLKKKLDELTRLGLAVSIRHNRMVISLPGDVLFDSGRDTLKKDGQEILAKVANVVKGDPQLLQRDYQVAGHTDGVALKGGTFHDNWGLSLMRARQVLLYLVGDKGGLPKEHWSAAGFAETDPVASNDTDDGKQKNRRCDLIVVPSVEEMLDLKAITQ
ncbi:MAG: OmpA family protein [Minicystis sp.]